MEYTYIGKRGLKNKLLKMLHLIGKFMQFFNYNTAVNAVTGQDIIILLIELLCLLLKSCFFFTFKSKVDTFPLNFSTFYHPFPYLIKSLFNKFS